MPSRRCSRRPIPSSPKAASKQPVFGRGPRWPRPAGGSMIQAATRPAARTRPWYRRLTNKHEIEFYMAISPWLIGFVLFTGGPVLAALLISFTRWQIIDAPVWVWFGNYAQLFTKDKLFWASTINTIYYVALSVPLGVIGSVLVALLLNQKVRGVALFRTIFYLPSVTSGVAMAILWVWLFNP